MFLPLFFEISNFDWRNNISFFAFRRSAVDGPLKVFETCNEVTSPLYVVQLIPLRPPHSSSGLLYCTSLFCFFLVEIEPEGRRKETNTKKTTRVAAATQPPQAKTLNYQRERGRSTFMIAQQEHLQKKQQQQ
jgi:hypothetical protein